jgi:NitT/TauT family transport system substrate-binding protein
MPTAPRPGLLAIVAALLLAGCAPPAAPSAAAPPAPGRAAGAPDAAAAPRVSVKAIYVAMGVNSAPFWLAKDAGFFDQQGLDVEMTYVAGAVTPAQSLTAGGAYFSSGGAASVTPARLAGADLILLGSQVDIYQFQVFARPEIQRPEQLRGTRMGITRLGAATDWAGKAALRYWGLEPNRDVSFVQLGGNPEILLGLETGAVESGLLTDPVLRQASQRGYRQLLDLADTGVHFSPTGLVTTDTIIREHEPLVRRFTRAWIDGIHYLATNKAGSLATVAKYMSTDEMDALSEGYDYHVTKQLKTIPYPNPASVQTVLDGLAETDPKAREAQPAQFINDRFLRELDDAGMFRQLYGG